MPVLLPNVHDGDRSGTMEISASHLKWKEVKCRGREICRIVVYPGGHDPP